MWDHDGCIRMHTDAYLALSFWWEHRFTEISWIQGSGVGALWRAVAELGAHQNSTMGRFALRGLLSRCLAALLLRCLATMLPCCLAVLLFCCLAALLSCWFVPLQSCCLAALLFYFSSLLHCCLAASLHCCLALLIVCLALACCCMSG